MKPHQTNTLHRRLPLPLHLAGALSLAFGASGAVIAHAAQIRAVENCNDSGAGSLREAYAGALDGDTVDLGALACSTITLTSGPLLSATDAGYVTLQGNQAIRISINGNHADRVLMHSGTRIAVNDLTITAGVAHDAL